MLISTPEFIIYHCLFLPQPDAGRIADQDKEKYEKEFDQYYKELEQAKQELVPFISQCDSKLSRKILTKSLFSDCCRI